MPPVKPMQQITEKWVRQSTASEASYEEGIKNPRRDWADATAKAEGNYKTAVTKAANEGRFANGVRKAGTAKWQQNAIAKGPARWSQGINLSVDAYEKGFAPFRQVIESVTLPERKEKGNPANIARVAAMAKALHDAKLRLRGSAS